MQFDPNNTIIKLCVRGMELEGKGEKEEALKLYEQAWDESTTDFEKFMAAHYVARHQQNVADKLKWDETALHLALSINDKDIKKSYPSLYLNIAKCYEDLNELDKAKENYNLALSFMDCLQDDGYGKMIKSGIESGLQRIAK